VLKVMLERRVYKEHKVYKALLALVHKVYKEHKVHRVQQVLVGVEELLQEKQ
jgi:Zn finger protein HypA/HybF involved in hydrogenase expression